jgi:hypothetical protein
MISVYWWFVLDIIGIGSFVVMLIAESAALVSVSHLSSDNALAFQTCRSFHAAPTPKPASLFEQAELTNKFI